MTVRHLLRHSTGTHTVMGVTPLKLSMFKAHHISVQGGLFTFHIVSTATRKSHYLVLATSVCLDLAQTGTRRQTKSWVQYFTRPIPLRVHHTLSKKYWQFHLFFFTKQFTSCFSTMSTTTQTKKLVLLFFLLSDIQRGNHFDTVTAVCCDS